MRHLSEDILIETKNLYDINNKNLRLTGELLGISKEAVRLRLKNYKKYFDDYTPKWEASKKFKGNKKNIVEELLTKGYKNASDYAKRYSLPTGVYVTAKLKLGKETYLKSRRIFIKKEIINEYLDLERELRYAPNTTYLFKHRRSLMGKIQYYWKTFKDFKNEVYK